MPPKLKYFSRLALWCVCASASARAGDPVMDAIVETSSGAKAHLASLWKRPTVLFYEDKDSSRLNQHVKDALFARGRDHGLLEAVSVVAVANVAAFDWFPARNFVLAAVRDVEREAHVAVYLDFKGALATAPWNLPPKSSTVLVLSPEGQVVWKAKGRLSEDELHALFVALEAQLTR